MHSYLSFLFSSIFWAHSETWEIANFTGVNPRQPPQGTLSPVSPLAYGIEVCHRGLCPPAYGIEVCHRDSAPRPTAHPHFNFQTTDYAVDGGRGAASCEKKVKTHKILYLYLNLYLF